ncbi:type II secretion system F family protein [Sphingobium boeckii]|uniref:Tight adherence protein B n=1 Tax=Sphingobium boeckii TaxID=1082345 RepID=A0A7W9AK11_9SPHN|nr:type II secretion system F family protein [Sphingobium boeckii]MBB5687060.1 tight adherence protein B [Sphingobium boeckii]
MENLLPVLMACGIVLTAFMVFMAFSGPDQAKIQSRRLSEMKDRHAGSGSAMIEAQMRRAINNRLGGTKMDGLAAQFLPRPEMLKARIKRTGKSWTMSQYGTASLAIAFVFGGLVILKGAPLALGLLIGVLTGLAIPHMAVNFLIKRRITQFNVRFPDAIDLLVRGLRAGLPISETLGVVSNELPGPVGEEFSAVVDKMRIGRTMDAALQETADKIGTPEFQFFCITLAIQRETGGNLSETLSNLSEVLRKRAQMKLKIKAMSSESKASAYIVGVLPFAVFGLIYSISPDYMGGFFSEPRLIVAGIGGLVWMSIGAGIMAKMVSFEI